MWNIATTQYMQGPSTPATATTAAATDQPAAEGVGDNPSPFRALRDELGLSRLDTTPALVPRRPSAEAFDLRLPVGTARDEANLQTAINEVIYNQERVQNFMRLSLTPAEATAVRDRQAARVLAEVDSADMTLRDVLWYLEYTDWDVEGAILQVIRDQIERNEAPAETTVSDTLTTMSPQY
jgi:hypothetical protein